MKKMICLVAGFAGLIALAYGSSYLFAQGGGAAPQVQGTKIAIVNIGKVFNEYKRAQAFKADLEARLAPYKDKAKKLADETKMYEDELRTNVKLTPIEQAQRQDRIKSNKRQMEDMSAEISRLLGKQQEENLVTLWKEVNMGIGAISKAYGFQIVLGYGDPLDKALLDAFPNVNRKMQAMDLGSTVPLYIHESVDISPVVVNTLNKWVDDNSVKQTGGKK